ncbi:peptidase U32 family protein [Pseudomonas sp. F1_0610]|uniref:ubiquinone anaerobic biosynthesis protein UbiU n=1 Tax=Pseudomonas sp. F1_0610 TaxID=3114284 RepID=UPI0039C3695E
MQLVCPAGSLPALKAAVRQGADAVYVGFKDDTNARHFAGLNFTDKHLEQGLDVIRKAQRKMYIAINTFANPTAWQRWQRAVDQAADLGVDALIVADLAVLAYAAKTYPDLNLHLSVQGSATNPAALSFYQTGYNIKRAVLPRVLSLAQVKQVAENSPVDIEVFAFGSLCIMAEGRCHLSSYLTAKSPNLCGVCSPAGSVRWQQTATHLEARLNDVLIDKYTTNEAAGYPTLCKGRFLIDGEIRHALEEPTSLNTMDLLPELAAMGVKAVKIEGRQRSPAYTEKVTQVWRSALDRFEQNPANYSVDPQWTRALAGISEGSQTTLGAYERAWQ